jgi:hypothetical protein
MEVILVLILISEVSSWHQPILRWSLIKQSGLFLLLSEEINLSPFHRHRNIVVAEDACIHDSSILFGSVQRKPKWKWTSGNSDAFVDDVVDVRRLVDDVIVYF